MTKFYIPTQDISFRILGNSSDHVLASVTHTDPDVLQVSHHPKDDVRPDQWFQLILGRGKYSRYSAIKSKTTGKVLFSRNFHHPRIGFKRVDEGGGLSAESWFKFEFGTGRHENCFRILNFASKTVLYSRTYTSPQVYNFLDSHNKSDEQYFSFLFEDMEIYWVDYHIDRSQILSSTPVVLVSQTLSNNSGVDQTMEFSLNETTTHTSTYEYSLGFAIDLGTSFTAHVPYVAEGQVKIDFTNTHQFKWGRTRSVEKTYSARLPVNAPAHTNIQAVSTVTRCEFDVPSIIYLKSTTTGRSVETQGMHKGVTTWDLRHNIAPSTYRGNATRSFRVDDPPDYFPLLDL